MTNKERKQIANYVIVKDKILASGREELSFASQISEEIFYADTMQEEMELFSSFATLIKTSPARLSDWFYTFWYYYDLECGDDL